MAGSGPPIACFPALLTARPPGLNPWVDPVAVSELTVVGISLILLYLPSIS
jgi:hypothetical protein